MKKLDLIQLIESIVINEIGEGTSIPYKYDVIASSNEQISAEFQTDSGMYYSVHGKRLINALKVDFRVINLQDSPDEFPETNKFELFRVMSTISKILSEYFKKYNDYIYLRYEPKQQGRLYAKLGNARDKIFRRYIQKAFPGTIFIEQGGTVFAKIK
jgi:hypothetical protein